MKTIQWTEEERNIILQRGKICYAVAEKAMIRSGFSFDDVERINQRFKNYRWGSNADRKYRAHAIHQAVEKVAANAAEYL